jgi:glucuronide carrier protein
MQADTVEYGEWRTGVRGEASVYSVLSFTRKTGQGVGGAAASFTLGLGGYVSGALSQPPEAITAIKIAAGIIPAAAILIGGIIMLGYPLTEDVFRRIIREIAARRERTRAANMAAAAG